MRTARSSERVAGVGLGLRDALAESVLRDAPDALRWLEVSPENYMERGGGYVRHLAQAAERYPIVTHGLTLDLGGLDPLDEEHLRALNGFCNTWRVPWHSDHLCWCKLDGRFVHDLLPLPFTRETVARVAARVIAAQRRLDVPLVLENISWYGHPGAPEMDEATFLTEVLEASDAGLLLDVNNVYVNARNHGFDAWEMIARLPLRRVREIHVAGHLLRPDGSRLDTHGESVCDDVYALLRRVLAATGPVPILLERDQTFPVWTELVAELVRLDGLWQEVAARGGHE